MFNPSHHISNESIRQLYKLIFGAKFWPLVIVAGGEWLQLHDLRYFGTSQKLLPIKNGPEFGYFVEISVADALNCYHN